MPYPAADALTYSTERGPVFETDPDLLLPNERGLEQLLARGALRKASLVGVPLAAGRHRCEFRCEFALTALVRGCYRRVSTARPGGAHAHRRASRILPGPDARSSRSRRTGR